MPSMNEEDSDLRAVAEVLARHGETALGGRTPEEAARLWTAAGFDDPDEVEEWLAARCFDAASALAVERAGLTPRQAATRTKAGTHAYEDTIAYKLSRGQLTFDEARRIVTRDFWDS